MDGDYIFRVNHFISMKLQVNIYEAEGMAIKELAKKDARSVSSYIRKIILEKLEETGNGTGE